MLIIPKPSSHTWEQKNKFVIIYSHLYNSSTGKTNKQLKLFDFILKSQEPTIQRININRSKHVELLYNNI